MSRNTILTLVAAVAFLGLAVVAYQATALADAPKDGITWTGKGTVSFDHNKHKADACKTCHHKEKDGKKHVKCLACHKKKKDTVEGDPIPSKKAFHKQCKGCHKKVVKKDETKKGVVPVKCKECHK